MVVAALERDIEAGESRAAQRADALVALAAPDGDRNHYQVTVHVSAETLRADGGIDADDPPEIEDGPVLAPDTVRRLACDAAIVPLIERANGEVLAIGRKSRTITPALRRAVKRRDAGCRFPGCTQMRFVDMHHIQHWADGGETRLDNLALLCRHHHRLIHEGGYTVKRTAVGSFEFCNPRGVVVPVTGETRFRGNVCTLFASNTVTIDADTAVPDWDGDDPDYDHVLWVMNQEPVAGTSVGP